MGISVFGYLISPILHIIFVTALGYAYGNITNW